MPRIAMPRTAVITLAAGRHGHLALQRAGLDGGSRAPGQYVVVAMGDPGLGAVAAGRRPEAAVVDCPVRDGKLPLARARNLGAAHALARGAELLVFLDVDCVPGDRLLERYAEVAGDRPRSLLCGTVAYLPPPPDPVGGYRLADLPALAEPHPARPAPGAGEIQDGTDHTLFWSLSFALTADTWDAVGGFCEEYEGYGGEDTDYGQRARAAGVGLTWVGGAPAFHQYHPTTDPPVGHLDDILRNGEIFHRRWGWWPMSGWLDAFAEDGLIRWNRTAARWEATARGDATARREATTTGHTTAAPGPTTTAAPGPTTTAAPGTPPRRRAPAPDTSHRHPGDSRSP
ncbi:glycosyltransferase family 2 protein [Streptomyces sp. DSM 40484]|uniref:glycosyltransferase family 2 protein n=1 Tax=Streptomyces kroppenstedtii TaxID=3051181 RepID=UPI0028D50430|nr:galactosyltransferase-related protein [Streptomyces sp. DSM 40484]